MADERSAVLRDVAWRDILPWLLLTKVFRQSVRLRVLALAVLATLLLTAGWRLLAEPFATTAAGGARTFDPLIEAYRLWPWQWEQLSAASVDAAVPAFVQRRVDGRLWSFLPVVQVVGLNQIFFADRAGLSVFLLLCVFWGLAVWSLLGGAITRIAAVALARDEQISWGEAIRFARIKWLSYLAAPLIPLVGVVLVTLLMALFALMMRIPWIGAILVGLGWPFWLIGGLMLTVLLLGLAASWPLMWGTISSEGTDSFDALGRSFGYLFGRPLRYLFYILVAVVLGVIGWLVVDLFARTIIALSMWAASWGSGDELIRAAARGPDALRDLNQYGVGASLFGFWNGIVMLVPIAFTYSYFWTAASAIYLLLRRDEDQTELDEVYLEEEQPAFGLPPLERDEAGVPGPADLPPESAPGAADEDGSSATAQRTPSETEPRPSNDS